MFGHVPLSAAQRLLRGIALGSRRGVLTYAVNVWPGLTVMSLPLMKKLEMSATGPRKIPAATSSACACFDLLFDVSTDESAIFEPSTPMIQSNRKVNEPFFP